MYNYKRLCELCNVQRKQGGTNWHLGMEWTSDP